MGSSHFVGHPWWADRRGVADIFQYYLYCTAKIGQRKIGFGAPKKKHAGAECGTYVTAIIHTISYYIIFNNINLGERTGKRGKLTDVNFIPRCACLFSQSCHLNCSCDIAFAVVTLERLYRRRSAKLCAIHKSWSGPQNGAKNLCAVAALPAARGVPTVSTGG